MRTDMMNAQNEIIENINKMSVYNILICIFATLLMIVIIVKRKEIIAYFQGANSADRYNLLVFLAVSAVSLFLLIFSSLSGVDSTIIYSLILLTLTSVTISVLLDRVGILKDIDGMMKRTSLNEGFKPRKEIESEYPIHKMWEDAKSISVVTMGGTAFFIGRLKENLDKALDSGVCFSLVTIKVDTPTWNEHYYNKMENKTTENVNACRSICETIEEHYKGKISYYLTEVNLPYALMLVEKKKAKDSFLKVDLYAIETPDGERPCCIIYQDNPYYEFYKNQIDIIIKKSVNIC